MVPEVGQGFKQHKWKFCKQKWRYMMIYGDFNNNNWNLLICVGFGLFHRTLHCGLWMLWILSGTTCWGHPNCVRKGRHVFELITKYKMGGSQPWEYPQIIHWLVVTGTWLDDMTFPSYWEWNSHPNWLIFFKMVETTNQSMFIGLSFTKPFRCTHDLRPAIPSGSASWNDEHVWRQTETDKKCVCVCLKSSVIYVSTSLD